MKILLLLVFITSCASVTPQTIEVGGRFNDGSCLTVKLYESQGKLQEAAKKYRKKFGLGYYNYIQNEILCEKWDFYSCGEELFHALRIWGSPRLILDPGYENFDNH